MPGRRPLRAFVALALALVALLAPSPTSAQSGVSVLREPVLYDTPWGDFPIGRLVPGARLRLTPPAGARVEVSVASVGDSSVQVRSPTADSLVTLSFTELRLYPRVEVHAIPRTRDRAGNLGFAVGVVLGGVAGGILHYNGGTSLARRAKPQSLGEDIAGMAAFGGFVGFMTGRLVIARARWRLVSFPR